MSESRDVELGDFVGAPGPGDGPELRGLEGPTDGSDRRGGDLALPVLSPVLARLKARALAIFAGSMLARGEPLAYAARTAFWKACHFRRAPRCQEPQDRESAVAVVSEGFAAGQAVER
jgi:hypothetical protein